MVGDPSYRRRRQSNTVVCRQGSWGGTNRRGREKRGAGENGEKKLSKQDKRRREKEEETRKKVGEFGALLTRGCWFSSSRCDGFPQLEGRVAVRYITGPEQHLEAVGSGDLFLGAKTGSHVSLSQ